jgi:23S rRNA pseudouridine2604 synthase
MGATRVSNRTRYFEKQERKKLTFVRLSKLMSERGICSRREADQLIEKGLVKVNGSVVNLLGTKVETDAKIELLERAKTELASKVTLILNKPVGFVSSQPELGYKTAMELLRPENQMPGDKGRWQSAHAHGLAPAGRLDIDSQGLIVYTQDGVLAKTLIGENSPLEKEYLVRVSGGLSEADLSLLNFGLSLDGKPLKRAKVEWLNEDQLRFVLREGKKRQIRRMCEAVGLTVEGLKRVRIGDLMLGNLTEGQWRYLQQDEYALLGTAPARAIEPHSAPKFPRR